MSKNKKEYCGLQNQGATCYLNAVLQTLYMTQEYRDLIKRHKPTDGQFTAELKELFDKLDKRKGLVSASGITEILGVDVGKQLDAAEYLDLILNKTPESSKIFMGKMRKTRTCNLCKDKYLCTNKFLTIHVPFEESMDVEDALAAYMKPRELYNLYCQSCKNMARMTSESEMESFPEILIIQLQRRCDVTNSSFELSVSINPHIKFSGQKYELYAVVNRCGSFNSGHYDAVIKSENQNWYRFDDSYVSQCEMCQRSSDACLLLYKRRENSASEMEENEMEKTGKHKKNELETPVDKTLTPEVAIEQKIFQSVKSGSLTGEDPKDIFMQDVSMMKLALKNKYQEVQKEIHMNSQRCGTNKDLLYIQMSVDKICTGSQYIKYCDIFKVFRNVRTVLTEGEEDAGKFPPVVKFILDWTEEKVDQDIKYILSIRFQELNTLAEKNFKLSLTDLLQNFGENNLTHPASDKVLLILDGLHEAKFQMDFEKSRKISDRSQSASIDVLLVNLIKGTLFPEVLIWITSHPTAAKKIPPHYITLLTRVYDSNQSTSNVQDNTQANTSVDTLSPSNSYLKELDLSENTLGDSGVQHLVDLLMKLENLKLSSCSIGEEGCVFLITALRSNPSPLRKLDLSGNTLKDSGIKFLSDMLKQPQSKLEKLRLRSCDITDSHCADLSSALRSNPSHLKELDLSGNCIKDSGVKEISALLKHSQCKLEKLRLSSCSITEDGCAALTADIRLNSHLRELELNENRIGNLGMNKLVDVLIHPWCKLEKLLLSSCFIGEAGCAVLRSALISNSSCLRKLDLSRNPIEDSGVKQLVDLLKHPQCKLEKLRLRNCSITENGCAALSSITSSKTEDVSAQIHADTDEGMCKYF